MRYPDLHRWFWIFWPFKLDSPRLASLRHLSSSDTQKNTTFFFSGKKIQKLQNINSYSKTCTNFCLYLKSRRVLGQQLRTALSRADPVKEQNIALFRHPILILQHNRLWRRRKKRIFLLALPPHHITRRHIRRFIRRNSNSIQTCTLYILLLLQENDF